jgi:hypothetical protein
MGFLIQGELSRGAPFGGSGFGHVRRSGRGCVEACPADYALHRDVQLIDHRPAPAVPLPGEDAMATIVGRATPPS